MSRVRIYDLARELHLDNKDVMAICEELGIPLKSHSSTITEEEASRVKITAQSGNRPTNTKTKPKSKEEVAKPQIVTVSKPKLVATPPPLPLNPNPNCNPPLRQKPLLSPN